MSTETWRIEVHFEAQSKTDAEELFDGIAQLVERRPEPDIGRSSVSLDAAEPIEVARRGGA